MTPLALPPKDKRKSDSAEVQSPPLPALPSKLAELATMHPILTKSKTSLLIPDRARSQSLANLQKKSIDNEPMAASTILTDQTPSSSRLSLIRRFEGEFGSSLDLDVNSELNKEELQRIVISLLGSHIDALKRIDQLEVELKRLKDRE
jgi:hypothetical protein